MVNSKSYVRITDDKTEAWLYLCAPEEGAGYDKTEIIQYLQKNKVVAGINESNVAAMCKKKIYEREVKIAVSETGEEGWPGIMNSFLKPVKENPQSGKMVQ